MKEGRTLMIRLQWDFYANICIREGMQNVS